MSFKWNFEFWLSEACKMEIFSRIKNSRYTLFIIEIWLLLHYHNNKNWPCTFLLIVLASDDLSAPKCIPICVCLFCYIKLYFTPNLYINLCIWSGVLKWRFTFFFILAYMHMCIHIYVYLFSLIKTFCLLPKKIVYKFPQSLFHIYKIMNI